MIRCAGFLKVLMLVVLLAACTGQATEAPLPDAASLLKKAADEVQVVKSFKVKLQVTGAPSYVDPPTIPGGTGNTIAFISADGYYVAPDKVSASVVATIFGIPGKVDVIAVGDNQWMRNQILTAGQWIERIFSPGFNAQTYISSDTGIQAALKAFKDIKVIGRENIDGVQMYHITGKASSADIAVLTFGLIYGSDVLIDVYIPVDTGRADRIIITQPDTVSDKYPKPTTWTMEMFDYNADLDIAAPAAPIATPQSTSPETPTAQPTADVEVF
jgi:hypothetical protein